MNGGSVPAARPRRRLVPPPVGVSVFLLVGPVAVAVLEVDAEVLDRLALQLFDDTRMERRGVGLRRHAGRASRPMASARSRGVAAYSSRLRSARAPSLGAESALQQVRAAVDGVDRLARRFRGGGGLRAFLHVCRVKKPASRFCETASRYSAVERMSSIGATSRFTSAQAS